MRNSLLHYFFKGVSRMPWSVLYALSSFIAWLLQYVIQYRKKIISNNISRSLPHLNESAKAKVTKEFYLNFCDTWIETIKLLTISKDDLQKRITVDFSLFNELHNSQQPATALIGHMFNWEYLNAALGAFQKLPLLTVYIPASNKGFDELMKEIRLRYAHQVIPASGLTKAIIPWRKKTYMLGLVADQSPAAPEGAYWLQFLHQPTAFVTGPHRNATVLGQTPVFIDVIKPRRGYYHFTARKLQADETVADGNVVLAFARAVEHAVCETPGLYLWSHKRWKHPWKSEYVNRWIDNVNQPPTN